MVIELNLKGKLARLSVVAGVLALCALLVAVIFYRFVVGTLSDYRLVVTRDMVLNPVGYFPNSARLNALAADAEMVERDRSIARGELFARRAADLSPFDYRFRVILAKVLIAKGDLAEAEQALRAGRDLAPFNKDVHYKLANLLVRQGKLSESLGEFRVAVAGNDPMLAGVLDLVWRASRESQDAVEAITGDDPKSRLTLAAFLLARSRVSEAAQVFRRIDSETRLASAETAALLNAFIADGRLDVARELWLGLVGADDLTQPVWNGGFESDILKNFAQFDWQLASSDYARVNIQAGAARTGSRCLRIDFLNRDTTVLDGEVKQIVSVRPGARYRVECYVKSEGLVTPEGPRLVVAGVPSSEWIGASSPVAAGSNDWQRLTVDFVAPQGRPGGTAVYVSIKRRPKNTIYEEPTGGTVWFDDFSIKEQ